MRYRRKQLDAQLHYDSNSRLRAISEWARGASLDTHFVYGADGRLEQVLRGVRGQKPQAISRYSYRDGCISEWQDALGGIARMRYDEARRMVQGTDRRGYSFHWQYDPRSGRCIKGHGDDGLWGVEASYRGATSTFKEPDGGVWTFKHYPDGTISHLVDPYGGVKQYLRDEETGRIVKQIMPGGAEYRWLYDRAGTHYGRSDQWAHQLPPEDFVPNPRDPLAHDGPPMDPSHTRHGSGADRSSSSRSPYRHCLTS